MKYNSRNHALHGCPTIYGPIVCRTRHRKIMVKIKASHKQLWSYVKGLWQDDRSEGSMLFCFRAFRNNGDSKRMCLWLSRRMGNPHRLLWTRCYFADLSSSGSMVGRVLEIRELHLSHCTGHELALQLLQIFPEELLSAMLFASSICHFTVCFPHKQR